MVMVPSKPVEATPTVLLSAMVLLPEDRSKVLPAPVKAPPIVMLLLEVEVLIAVLEPRTTV